jgi:cytochrome bd-type quinol oxidase subunit 2
METNVSTAAVLTPLRLYHKGVAAIAGAIAGAIIGPETSAIFGLGIGGLAIIGAPFGAAAGALVGVAAQDLLTQSTRRPEHAEHRASWATTLAAAFLIGGAVLSAVLWDVARRGAEEMDGILVVVLLPPIAILVVSLVALAVGVLRRRATARWAAVVVSVCACAASFSRLLAELSPLVRGPGWAAITQTPEWRISVLQAALFATIPIAVTALLLSPAARRDFQ